MPSHLGANRSSQHKLKRSNQNSTYVLFLVVAILLFFIAPEEEVQRRTLNLDYGVEAAKRYNRNGFRIVPAW